MKTAYSMTTSNKEFVGAELEQAYADVFGGRVVGGFYDRGLDVVTNDETIPAVQVKSSLPMACKFLEESKRRRKFVPICIGDPGRREDVLKSLKQFGAWVALDIPQRDRALQVISELRRELST